MSLRYIVFHEQRHACFSAATFVTSLLAFTTLPTFIPLVLNLSFLLIYAPILLNDHLFIARITLLWLALAVGKSYSLLTPSLNALSTPAMSLFVLLVQGLVTSAIALLVVLVYTRSRTRIPRWSQATLFPALWASVWCALPYVSPVGFLTSWSPIVGVDAYNWFIPVLGPSARDWLAAGWAVVLSETLESWYMGSKIPEEQPLIPHPSAEGSRSTRTFHGTLALGLVLSALTIPSFYRADVALPVISTETTPLAVGCVLPPFRTYKHHVPTLEDFITESRKLTSANILLWPEGAVSFADESERNAALTRVQSEVRGPYVGVSFEEWHGDPSDPSGRRRLRRTGMALVSNYSASPHMIYFKRNLVPIAESYRLEASDNPSPLYGINLRPPKDMKKIDWAPPPYERRVPVTTSICLDFAKPSVFADLDSKPALILAPARTWDISIGESMWEQGKQRALELDTTILWCDGGEGGVSGVAGRGISEPTQVGEGSWVRSIGLQYPFDESQTFYARYGNSSVLFYWVLAFGGFALQLPALQLSVSGSWNILQRMRQNFLEWRARRALTQRENGVAERNLLE